MSDLALQAELHACSDLFRGVSSAQELVTAAVAAGLTHLAVLDRDGLSSAVKLQRAADAAGIKCLFGAELSFPEGVLGVLCIGLAGYQELSAFLSADYPPLATCRFQHLLALVDYTWLAHLSLLQQAFGENLVVERHISPLPDQLAQTAQLLNWAKTQGLPVVATARPACAYAHQASLIPVREAIASRQTLRQVLPFCHPFGGMWVQPLAQQPAEQRAAAKVVARCYFRLPKAQLPAGDIAELRRRVAQSPRQQDAQHVEYELQVIEQLGFTGYFLYMHDIVQFCQRQGIMCQGRGSAANSSICFLLGITNVDPLANQLLFERFLSPARTDPPDIDLDIQSDRRHEVVNYVMEHWGKNATAQVATVVTLHRRGAVRDAARVLELPATHEKVQALAERLIGLPRHFGTHPGGMIILDEPVVHFGPVRPGGMIGSGHATFAAQPAVGQVLLFDKDDVEYLGLVKYDLLGLGMLTALQHMQAQVPVPLEQLDFGDAAVYSMLAKADAIGVFQVESRAQLSTLPRLKPANFFDLVIDIALIRPGPIQGGSVHPLLRRRAGKEPVTVDHPSMGPALRKTMGVVLFQEQVMRLAVDVAGFTPTEADIMRRDPLSAREQFYAGMAKHHGITGELADRIWEQVSAFASYGFPESHAQSFAAITYYSAWYKRYYPAVFTAALLRAQPMGFYSPQTLLGDARRHGVKILPIDVQESTQWAEAETDPQAPQWLRLGLDMVVGLPFAAAQRIAKARQEHGPFSSVADLVVKAGLARAEVVALAKAGALASLTPDRGKAIWQAGGYAAGQLPFADLTAPELPQPTLFDELIAERTYTSVNHRDHPLAYLRPTLKSHGVVCAQQLCSFTAGEEVRIVGEITHYQRPPTAGGILFLGLEDETGLSNIVCSKDISVPAVRVVLVTGVIQKAGAAVSVRAKSVEALPAAWEVS